MPKRIYVENLSKDIGIRQVRSMFSKFGEVTNVKLASNGTAYVEMTSGADEAIKSLDKTKLGRAGKSLNVNEA